MLRAALISALAVGCASKGASDSAFDLTVSDAKMVNHIGATYAASGKVYIVVSAMLANTGASEPAPADLTRFSLENDVSIAFDASAPATNALPSPCETGLSVALGGTHTCQVAFEVPTATTGSTLLYKAGPMVSATATITSVTPLPMSCESWPADTTPCYDCVTHAGTTACAAMAAGVGSACKASCLDMSRWGCPSVVTGCDAGASCGDKLAAYDACIYMQCDSTCR